MYVCIVCMVNLLYNHICAVWDQFSPAKRYMYVMVQLIISIRNMVCRALCCIASTGFRLVSCCHLYSCSVVSQQCMCVYSLFTQCCIYMNLITFPTNDLQCDWVEQPAVDRITMLFYCIIVFSPSLLYVFERLLCQFDFLMDFIKVFQ